MENTNPDSQKVDELYQQIIQILSESQAGTPSARKASLIRNAIVAAQTGQLWADSALNYDKLF